MWRSRFSMWRTQNWARPPYTEITLSLFQATQVLDVSNVPDVILRLDGDARLRLHLKLHWSIQFHLNWLHSALHLPSLQRCSQIHENKNIHISLLQRRTLSSAKVKSQCQDSSRHALVDQSMMQYELCWGTLESSTMSEQGRGRRE